MSWRLLSDLMRDSDRFEKMARAWYLAKGKPYPGDPARAIVDAVKANGGVVDQRLAPLILTKPR